MLKFIELLNSAYFKAKEAPLEIDSDGQFQLHRNRDNEESVMEEHIGTRPPEHAETNATDATVDDTSQQDATHDHPSRQASAMVETKDGKKMSSTLSKQKNI